MGLLDDAENRLKSVQSMPNATGPTTTAPTNPLQNALVQEVLGMLSKGGGLGGLLQSFQQGGLGHIFSSWVSSGHNLPISAGQIEQILGSGKIGQLAQSLGIQPSLVTAELSKVLPQVIDHATPGGQLPQGDIGGILAGIAGKFLHGRA